MLRPLTALEFFSGIGGLHVSLDISISKQVEPVSNVHILEAFDVNEVANEVYAYNFSHQPTNRDILHLSLEIVEERKADLWLLSPPCQPFTHGGKRLDDKDSRSAGFLHLLSLLELMQFPPTMIFLENVEGFYGSFCHTEFCRILRQRKYMLEEYILSPCQIGVPNTRTRYYALASNKSINLDTSLYKSPPFSSASVVLGKHACDGTIQPIGNFLLPRLRMKENDEVQSLLLEKTVIEKNPTFRFDIVTDASTTSTTFTKGYGQNRGKSGPLIDIRGSLQIDSFRHLTISNDFGFIRYFHPREILRLHGYPDTFDFPDNTSRRQRWALVGNSVNIQVVSVLLHRLLVGAGQV